MREKLRIGVLVDGMMIPAWAYKMLQKINELGVAEIVLVVKKVKEKKTESFASRLMQRKNGLFYSALRRVEKKIFKVNPDAFSPRLISDLLPERATVLEVTTTEKKFSDYVSAEDISKIREFKVDVFLRLGFRILRGDILRTARFGVWSYHHGDNNFNRGGPAGAWEVIKGWETTGVILQVLTEDLDGGTILYQSSSTTDLSSINRNVNNYYWKALSFVPRKLKELYELGEEEFFKRVEEKDKLPVFYSERLFTEPGNWTIAKHVVRSGLRIMRRSISNLYSREQWILLFSIEKTRTISRSFFRFKKILPPADRFWADPHVIERNGTYYVFLEEYFYKTSKGHISCMEIDAKGICTTPKIILDKPYHLSYPFVFEDSGVLYMIPETQGNKTIELYRCTDFPYGWEFERNLMTNVEAFDVTILFENNIYWLFTNMRENVGASSRDELFLFYSADLKTDNWTAHPANPIVSDVTRARPAGKFFHYQGNLYRPSQNSSGKYGYGMKINKVNTLSTSQYEEETVSAIYPNWDPKITATHSFSSDGKVTIIDGLQRRMKYP